MRAAVHMQMTTTRKHRPTMATHFLIDFPSVPLDLVLACDSMDGLLLR